LAARFTSTSVQAASFGSAPAISLGKIGGPARLSKAKEIAEDCHLQLRGKLRAGEIKGEKTFREVPAQYPHEYDITTQITKPACD